MPIFLLVHAECRVPNLLTPIALLRHRDRLRVLPAVPPQILLERKQARLDLAEARLRMEVAGPFGSAELELFVSREGEALCGKAACRCKDPKAPKRHGPYYQISYGRKGKSSSAFVRPESLSDVKKQLANYKRLMELISLWIDLGLEHSKIKLKSVCKKPERSNP